MDKKAVRMDACDAAGKPQSIRKFRYNRYLDGFGSKIRFFRETNTSIL
jgi:hypothetical protein